MKTQELYGGGGHSRRGLEDRLESDIVEDKMDSQDPEGEAEIAHPVDDESLDRCGIRRRPVVPKPDQQIGGEADTFPPEEELHEVVGCHEHQHEEAEKAEIAHE